MGDILTIDAASVAAQIGRLRTEYPELDDDPELLAGMIDGETDFQRVLENVTLASIEATTMKEGALSVRDVMLARAERFGRKAEGYRAVALALMKSANKRMAVLPCATISVRTGSKRTVIDDIEALPQGYYRTERKAMTADIGAALATGDQIPGAHQETGPETLAVRTK